LAQHDVYLNDLVTVEYGSGADFTLTFDQTPPLQFSAESPAQRDEIIWNLLTVRRLSIYRPGPPMHSFVLPSVRPLWYACTARSRVADVLCACVCVQINDLFCHGQPEMRAVDLHGLSLTATTQNFMGRNEVLGKYMAALLEKDKSKLARGNQMMLMDPFLNLNTDEELEGMLNGFKVGSPTPHPDTS
jgi:hypothetical protein